MTDLASLDIKVDSRSADTAATSLDKLTLAGQRVEKATQALANAQAAAADRVRDAKADYDRGRISLEGYNQAVLESQQSMRGFQREYNTSLKGFDKLADGAKAGASGIGALGGQSQLASHHMLNLGYQINDVVVGLASGQKPLTVFIQQGAQIGQIGAQAGVGLGGMAKAVGSLALRLAAAHPVLTGMLVAIGATTAATKVFTDELTKSAGIDKYVKSLGLTRAELKHLEDQHVTFGDVFKGVWKTIDDATGASDVWSKMSSEAGAAFMAVGKAVVGAGVAIVSAFEAAYDNVKELWANLPEILGQATVAAANAAIRGMQALINAAIQDINALNQRVNEALHTNLFGSIAQVELPQIKAQFSAAGQKAATAFSDDFNKRVAANTKALSGVVSTITGNIVDATKARLKKEAQDLVGDKKPKTDKHAEELAREAEAIEAQIRNLYKLADAYGQSGAAALVAEAREKAESEAIKKRGDVEEFVARQIRLAIAQRVADAARATAAMFNQAAAQNDVNKMVAAGLAPAEDAARLVKEQMEDLPLLAAIQVAQQKGMATELARATQALIDQRVARATLTQAEKESKDLQLADEIKKRTALTEQEGQVAQAAGEKRLAALRGLSGEPLEDALAAINAEQEKSNILLRAQAEIANLLSKNMGAAALATAAQAGAAANAVDQAAAQQKAETKIERQKQQFLDVAQQFADIVGGGLGKAVNAVLPLLDKVTAAFSGASTLAKLAAGAGIGGVVAGATGGNGATGALGGALGGLAGKAAASALAKSGISSILGPALEKSLGAALPVVGSIAGSLLSGVIGGLFKKVQKSSATIETIAGDATQTALTGTSSKLKAAAGSMADSLIKGLEGIADQLGGDIAAGVSASIGTRKKKFVVDSTGSGRTKGAGVASFDTQEEAVAYAVQNVIQRGAITGLSAAEQTLLKGKGDLQTQLQKALDFKGVFDELKQKTDPVGYAMDQIAAKFDKLEDVFKEAGATSDDYAKLQQLRAIEEKEAQAQAQQAVQDDSERLGLERQLAEAMGDTAKVRQMELDQLQPANREIQQHIYALQDEAEAASKAAELADQRRQLEIQLMEAQGDSAGALAAQREDELAAMDASLRPLQQMVYAATDAAKAAQDAADAQAKATELLKSKRDLEIQLMEATGNAAGALAARRADELAAADPLLRSIMQQIYAAQDAATAQDALAKAQQEAADAAQAAAEKEAEIASQRADLINELLRATGQEAQAVANERAAILAKTDDALKALQQQVWAAQDAKAAQEAAAQAAQEAAQAAEEAAQKQAQIEKDRVSLQIQLLTAQGNTAAATALQRQQELAAMDASLRPLQQLVYAEQDRAQAIADAKGVLTDAYQAESAALTTTIDKFKQFSSALRDFRSTLDIGGTSSGDLRQQFLDVASKAAMGDSDALSSLKDVSEKYLADAKDKASSLVDYQRAVAEVGGAVDKAIAAADEATDYAQAQLDALNKSVDGLIEINKSVLTVAQAIANLQAAMGLGKSSPSVPSGGSKPSVPSVPTMPQTPTPPAAGAPVLVQDLGLREALMPLLVAMKVDTGKTARILQNVTEDGDAVKVVGGDQ